MKKLLGLLMCLTLILALFLPINSTYCSTQFEPEVDAKACILMDSTAQNILYQNNEKTHLPVASVVKLMTILLIEEEIDNGRLSLTDTVVASENASGMGGSQIFLDANAEYKVESLLKSIVVCSANDSSVAMAEHIAGNEASFVQRMNTRAKELQMNDTNYENCTGLPSPNQYSCAKDIAVLMSKVIHHPSYLTYCKIWMEDFVHPSGRINEMVNTNKLIRFYEGCESGKTGSTNEAGYCLSVSAKRNNLHLISVVLGAKDSKGRFKSASDLLNYGFGNFSNYEILNTVITNQQKVKVQYEKDKYLKLKPEKDFVTLLPKGETNPYTVKFNLPNNILYANVGDSVGFAEILKDGVVQDTINILADEQIDQPSLIDYIKLINQDFVA